MNRTFGIALLLVGLIVGLSIGAVVAPKPLPSKPETYQVTAAALLQEDPVVVGGHPLVNVTAICQTGDKVVSGGYELIWPFEFGFPNPSREATVERVYIFASRPLPDGTGWLVTGFQEGFNRNHPDLPILQVTAVCVVLHK